MRNDDRYNNAAGLVNCASKFRSHCDIKKKASPTNFFLHYINLTFNYSIEIRRTNKMYFRFPQKPRRFDFSLSGKIFVAKWKNFIFPLCERRAWKTHFQMCQSVLFIKMMIHFEFEMYDSSSLAWRAGEGCESLRFNRIFIASIDFSKNFRQMLLSPVSCWQHSIWRSFLRPGSTFQS